MKHSILPLILLSFFTFSCRTVPITGREQPSFVPASQILPTTPRPALQEPV